MKATTTISNKYISGFLVEQNQKWENDSKKVQKQINGEKGKDKKEEK